MRKITYLLSLFLLMVGTAMAQTFFTPDATKVLTAEALRGLTTETPIVLCPVQESNYQSWYDGATGTYATSGSAVTEANVFVWVPILSEGAATGTGYLKKRTAESSDVAYLQSANTTTFGAQATAQVFYAVKPYIGGTGNAQIGDATSIGSLYANYNVENLVRLVCGSAEGTTWFNFNGKIYNGGTGVWTAMEVRDASGTKKENVLTSLDQLSNNKAYTLVTRRGALAVNEGGTTTEPMSLNEDESNTRCQWALLKNSTGDYFLYNIAAGKFLNKDKTLVDNVPDDISFKANTEGTHSGTFTLYYDGSHYINISAGNVLIDSWTTVDDGNAYTIASVADFTPSEELLAKLEKVSVKFKYVIGGSTCLETERNIITGKVLSTADFTADLASTLLTVESWDKTDAITENGTTVTVTCRAVYPFEPTTVADGQLANDTKWYTMNVNQGADKNVYTEDGDGVKVNGTRVLDANYLWCFELVDGTYDQFRIYNLEKGVGAPLTLVKNTSYGEYNQATASTGTGGTETTQFRLVRNGTGYCLQHPDQPEANIGDHGTGDGTFMVWQGGGSPTHEKSRIFFQSADDLITGVQQIKESEFVGGYINVPENLTAQINTYGTTPNVANLKNMADANEAAVAAGMVRRVLEAGKYYELLTYKRVKGARLYLNPVTANGTVEEDLDAKASTDCSVVSSLWQFVPTADGRYKVTHANTGKSLGTGRSSGSQTLMNVPADDANAGTYVLVAHNTECDVWGIQCNNNNYLNMNNYSGEDIFMYWVDASNDDGSPWQIREVSDIALTLNNTGTSEKTYATTYLPFDVTLPADGSVKAYIVMTAADGVATVAEVVDVPAGQGVILEGQTGDATAATLTIATATADCTGNLLEGTNPRFTIEETAKANYYILSNGTNGVGFYHPNSTTLKENRAFLRAANVTGQGVNGFRLDFGGQTTAISGVEAATEGSAAVYDLSGRRVVRPAKGIYVKNGKKVYVK